MNPFRKASRTEAKPLIGLYSESGCGKTWSSLLLARGYVGPEGKIGMIETEGGRGEAYVGRAPVGEYLVNPIRGNFAPAIYGEAISDAEHEHLDALIIDSASHEWEGAGGVLSLAADNQARGTKGVLVWQQPKIMHQRHFMLRLMQTPIPLVIVCMRAKYPMEQRRNEKGELEWMRSTKLEPKQADDILFEMMCHGWIDQDHNLHVTKYTLPELAEVLLNGRPIDLDSGRRLAQWAAGDQPSPVTPLPVRPADRAAPDRPNDDDKPSGAAHDPARLTEAELIAGYDAELATAAETGDEIALRSAWQLIPNKYKSTLKGALERRHKPRCNEVAAARPTPEQDNGRTNDDRTGDNNPDPTQG